MEKQITKKDVFWLKTTYSILYELKTREHIQFVRSAVEQQIKVETSHQDEIEGWRKRIARLVKWVGEAQQKLNKQFAIAPDLDTVKKQKENIQVCQA